MQVVVFRHQLFKLSEPFIWHQARAFRQVRPVYAGQYRSGPVPVGATSVALEDEASFGLARRLWTVATRSAASYERLLAPYAPGLVHAHFGVEGVYALPLARRLDVPLVTTFHGFDATTSTRSLLTSGSPSWINYALRRGELARGGQLFLCVSEYLRSRLLALGFPESRTAVHYIGVDTDAISERSGHEEKPLALHVARLVEKKGTEYLIRAFAEWRRTRGNVEAELKIAGDGPMRPSLEALVSELGLDCCVKFLGALPHDQVLALMREAAVVVVPSVTAKSGDSEGLPIVALEAGALGVPVIGTIHSGIPEAIEHERTGMLVRERDAHELAIALDALFRDEAARRAMGRSARARVEEKFSVHKQSGSLERIYAALGKS